MKNYKEVVGIDVSKKTIDAYCYHAQVHKEFNNDIVGYKSLLKWVLKETKEVGVFYCFENTGYYSLKLALYLDSQKIVYVEESPLKIKRSSGRPSLIKLKVASFKDVYRTFEVLAI